MLATCTSVGLILMVWQLRTATPLWLVALAQDALQLKFPAQTGETARLSVPLMPVLAVGAMIYLWGIR